MKKRHSPSVCVPFNSGVTGFIDQLDSSVPRGSELVECHRYQTCSLQHTQTQIHMTRLTYSLASKRGIEVSEFPQWVELLSCQKIFFLCSLCPTLESTWVTYWSIMTVILLSEFVCSHVSITVFLCAFWSVTCYKYMISSSIHGHLKP